MAVLLSGEVLNVPQSSIIVIDPHALSRSCLARILRSELPDFTVLEIAATDELDAFIGKHVDLTVLNIERRPLTDEPVLENLADLRQSLPETPVVLLTQFEESAISDAMISAVARSGVRGYITHASPVEVVLAALRLVLAGGVYFPRSVVLDDETYPNWATASSEHMVSVPAPVTINGETSEVSFNAEAANVAFTQREREVLATLQRGLSNKIIASELNLSQNTIKVHISHIMRKLNATNRTEAALVAQRNLLNPT
ncbi:response regulator transcription factor [Pseudaminobacter sp. NGMCC 1.201702]|uniref:response regulator transcription factor n=1 Tax=Pseudaminobacter sp. NGMCC 1.201702 TaxID=3391825 RepID=UPI0039EF8318